MSDIELHRPASPIPTDAEAQSLMRLAETMAASGLFKDTRQASQAFAKILFGRDLGLGATQAMTGVDIIEGKPALSANLQAALLRQYRSPEGARYDYRADVSSLACEVVILRTEASGETVEVGRTTFSMEDAKQAGLARGNYVKYAPNMLFARAISNAVAFFAPEVTYGTRTYSEGELSGELVAPSPVPAAEIPEPDPHDEARRHLREAFAVAKRLGMSEADLHEAFDGIGVRTYPDIAARVEEASAKQLGDVALRVLDWTPDAEVVDEPEHALNATGGTD